jgi:hypothetical protein
VQIVSDVSNDVSEMVKIQALGPPVDNLVNVMSPAQFQMKRKVSKVVSHLNKNENI